MNDRFSDHTTSLTAPAQSASAIVPNDSADLNKATRAVFVGGAGDLRVRMVDGSTVTFSSVQAGLVYPLRIARVLASGTTATNLIALD